MQNGEETAEINGEEKIKVRGHKAGNICSMIPLMLPCFYLLLATSLLTLSSHHRRRLVFAYAVSPIPVSNPCRSFISCLHLFISFSEQFLHKTLPPKPFFACFLKLSKASVWLSLWLQMARCLQSSCARWLHLRESFLPLDTSSFVF